MLEAVRQDWRALEHASAEVKADREIMLEATRQNADVLRFASEELKAETTFMMACLNNSATLVHASACLKADRDFMLRAVTHDGMTLRHASDELRSARDIVHPWPKTASRSRTSESNLAGCTFGAGASCGCVASPWWR